MANGRKSSVRGGPQGGRISYAFATAGRKSRRTRPDPQLIEYHVDNERITIGRTVIHSAGDVVRLYSACAQPLGLFRVDSVEPAIHPSTGRPPRAAACHVTPLPPGGQGETPPSTGDAH